MAATARMAAPSHHHHISKCCPKVRRHGQGTAASPRGLCREPVTLVAVVVRVAEATCTVVGEDDNSAKGVDGGGVVLKVVG